MNTRGPIVVIEDDKDDQALLELAFQELAFPNQVLYFSDPVAAVQYLKAPEVNPFIILSDINMPRLNGFELKRVVQTDGELARKSIPFIFFSTSVNKKSVDAAFDMSVQGYFVKPGNFETLKSTIRNIVEYWKGSYSPSRYTD